MGRDLKLYPQRATKDDLKFYLEGLGFYPCKHLWSWPKGTLNYAWFDSEDFKSIDGVSADIYPTSAKESKISKNKWALHVRNRYSGSWYDVKMLNDVLRGARKLFGGTIRGDYGVNRYAPLWEDKSTPISRGISGIYQHIHHQISAVKYALPNASINPETVADKKNNYITDYIKSMDPSRVIYNGLVPFVVSMFEYFFSEAFQILITYDRKAIDKKNSHKQKVEFSTLIGVGNKERSVESVIAENYTFQNLNKLNKAYKDWLDIDVRKILYKKRKIGNSITFLENRISEIIQYRHGVVHHFAIDQSLTKDLYLGMLQAVEKSIEEFVCFIEKKYKIKIERI